MNEGRKKESSREDEGKESREDRSNVGMNERKRYTEEKKKEE